MDEATRRSPLLRGEIVFDESPLSFVKASVHIYLEDTTLVDASAKVVLHQVVSNVAADTVQNERIPFAFDGTVPNTQAHYTVRVLVDVDDNGRISHGDYVNTVSYPVLTRGYPDQVVVHVRKVR
jgi:hypothetical protein